MNVIQTDLPGVFIIEPKVHGDSRGFFVETWHLERYEGLGMPSRFVQDNLSFSAHGILRGLHFQHPNAQGKLVYVLQGEVFDVAVDIRIGSPTFGQWTGTILSENNKRQMYVPAGYAHGFCVTGPHALFAYKVTEFYDAEADGGILWSDPDIAVDWPILQPALSEKDRNAPRLKDMPPDRLPKYGAGQ